MPFDNSIFYSEAALIDRLTTGVLRADQSIILLVGSPLTAPARLDDPGVPNVEGMIKLIGNEFDEQSQAAEFQNYVSSSSNKYQAAFSFLLGR